MPSVGWLAADSLLTAVGAKAQAAYRTKALAALHMLNNAQFLSHAAAGKELRAVAEPWLDGHKVGMGDGELVYICVIAG